MSLPEPGAAEKNESLKNEPSPEKEAGVTARKPPADKDDDIIEDPAVEKKDGILEDPPAEKKDDDEEVPPAKKKVRNLFPTEKSPVQLLQEHSDKSGEEAAYEFDTVGASSQLRFICRVRVGVEVFTGAGISKKAAKQSAAGAVLEALDLRLDPALADAPKAPAFTPEGHNPISVLNQLTSQKKIPTAEYAVVGEQVMANRTLFTMSCRVGKVVETGSGPCKKVAKQEAALKVLEKLKREPVVEPNTAPANQAGASRHFPEHQREIHGGRARVSPYPCTTRPFHEPRRGPTVQNFDSTPGKNAHYPLSEVFPNTGSIRPPMDLRQEHSAQEMHRAQGYEQYPWVHGALNSGATRSLIANERCSAEEFNRQPADHALYPLAQVSLNSGTARPFLAHHQHGVAQELNTAPRDDPAFHLARDTLNSGTVGPLMEIPQDHGAQENCIVPGNDAPDTGFRGSLNTGTIGPPPGHPQYHSAQKRNRPPGDNAQYPLAQQSLNSGIIGPLQTHQQDTAVSELCPAPKANTHFQPVQVSLNPGTIGLPTGHRGYSGAQGVDLLPKNNAQYPWPQTLSNTDTIRSVQEHRRDNGAQQLNTTMGKNAEYTEPPLKLSRTHTQTPEHQQDTNAQELKTALEHNAGGTGYSLNPTMVKFLQEPMQGPSIQELRTALGYIAKCTGSSPNPAITRPLQECQQDPSAQDLKSTLGQNAGCTGSSLNPTMIRPLQEHPQDPSTRELNTTLGYNAGCMSTSLNPAMIKPHQEQMQDPSTRQSTTTQGNDAQCIWSQVSQNTVALTPSLQQHGDLKPQELNPATGTNAGLTFLVYSPKPTSMLGPALKHPQQPRAEQVTTPPGSNADYTLASPIPRTTKPLSGHWQGTHAPGFNMKQGSNVQYLWAQPSIAIGTPWPPHAHQPGTSAQEFNSTMHKYTGSARTFVSPHPPSTVGTNRENMLHPSAAELSATQKKDTGSTWAWSAPNFPGCR